MEGFNPTPIQKNECPPKWIYLGVIHIAIV